MVTEQRELPSGQQPNDRALPLPKGDHHRWRTFLRNQLRGSWAAKLFVVQTVSYRILYVFFVLRHHRQEWLPFNLTASPTAVGIWQPVMEATPLSQQPKF